MDFIHLYPAQIIAILFVLLLISLLILIDTKGELKSTREVNRLLSDTNDDHWNHYYKTKEAYTKYGNECLQYAKNSRSLLFHYMLWVEENHPNINDEFSKYINTQQTQETYENENVEGRV